MQMIDITFAESILNLPYTFFLSLKSVKKKTCPSYVFVVVSCHITNFQP